MKKTSPSFAGLRVTLLTALIIGSIASWDRGAIAQTHHQVTAEEVLRKALERAESYHSISAKIRHQSDLFGRSLVGTGSYHQIGQGAEKRFRFELRMPIALKLSTRLEVCDGEYLWVHETFGDKSQLTQIDMRQVRRAVARAKRPTGTMGATGLLSVGGVPLMISTLQRSFDFSATATTEAATGRRLWTLHGVWKKEVLAQLLGDKLDKSGAGQGGRRKLPGHLPDAVTINLGRDDFFPYEITYLRINDDATERQMVAIQWFAVRINESIARRLFVYEPGNAARINGTDRFLKRLGTAARRR